MGVEKFLARMLRRLRGVGGGDLSFLIKYNQQSGGFFFGERGEGKKECLLFHRPPKKNKKKQEIVIAGYAKWN